LYYGMDPAHKYKKMGGMAKNIIVSTLIIFQSVIPSFYIPSFSIGEFAFL
jgi:hypothetical protein